MKKASKSWFAWKKRTMVFVPQNLLWGATAALSLCSGYFCWTDPWGTNCLAMSGETVVMLGVSLYVFYKHRRYGWTKKFDGEPVIVEDINDVEQQWFQTISEMIQNTPQTTTESSET